MNRPSPFSVASKTAFDFLTVEGGESDSDNDSRLETPPVAIARRSTQKTLAPRSEGAPAPTSAPAAAAPPVEPAPSRPESPKPLSKTAQKKAAKAAKAAIRSSSRPASPDSDSPTVMEPISKATESPPQHPKPLPQLHVPSPVQTAIPVQSTIVPPPEPPIITVAPERLLIPDVAPDPSTAASALPSATSTTQTLPNGNRSTPIPRKRSSSPSSSPWQPSLPASLPVPASPGLGPRKRKASQDLKSHPLPKESKVEFVSSQDDGTVEIKLVPAENPPSSAEEEKAKKRQKIITRAVAGLAMFSIFVGLMLLGHVYMIMLVLVCQTLVYREVTALFSLTHSKHDPREPVEGRDPWSKTLNWYFFMVANYFLYGESIIYYFKHVVFSDSQFLPFAMNHRFISFMLYIGGFVGFVASLKRQFLRQQFGLFCWVHMSLLVIVVSSHFIVNNILEGMIWFWLPTSLVICNDIMAYVFGMTMGKTPLIKLSPKKTVEGFVGGFFSTLIVGVIYATFFMQFQYMICPVTDLGTSAWSGMHCDPNPVFVWRQFEIWRPVNVLLSSILQRSQPIPAIWYAPFQLHAFIIATFASLVAPFGGFFASGFKRAFDIKDFGDSIPGHGGMTDRMDCQFLMGMWSYVYYSSLIRTHHVTVGSVLQLVVSSLSVEEQLELFADLKHYLETVVRVKVPA